MDPLPPPVDPPERLLLGPGPSPVPSRVRQALAAPTLGHLDPAFLGIMAEVQGMLRTVFGTHNPMTFPVSGTGMAAMGCALGNLLEPGDRCLVLQNGVFGARMAEVARRAGAEVEVLERPFGEVFDGESVAAALAEQPAKVVAFVLAETSTGALQPVAPVVRAATGAGALTVVDAVTALGGLPVETDAWGVDVVYAGTQKCLSAPPGLAPITFGPRAMAAVEARRTQVRSWYLDVSLLAGYWGGGRAYHHTAPVNMIYALHEALRGLLDEGLDAAFARHASCAEGLTAAAEALGLPHLAEAPHRLPMLHCLRLPDDLDEAVLRRTLLERHGIEIGGGLGPLSGRAWRIGLMGHGARPANVLRLVAALEAVLGETGLPFEAGAPTRAAAAAM